MVEPFLNGREWKNEQKRVLCEDYEKIRVVWENMSLQFSCDFGTILIEIGWPKNYWVEGRELMMILLIFSSVTIVMIFYYFFMKGLVTDPLKEIRKKQGKERTKSFTIKILEMRKFIW